MMALESFASRKISWRVLRDFSGSRVGMATWRIFFPRWFAIAWAVIVFPVPDGPWNSKHAPCPYATMSVRPTSAQAACHLSKFSTAERRSRFLSSASTTSSKRTCGVNSSLPSIKSPISVSSPTL